MTVVVLYFAALRELLGINEETLAIPPGALTVQKLGELLGERHPNLLPYLPSVRFAVNESFVNGTALIGAGDTVALIPPVSGG